MDAKIVKLDGKVKATIAKVDGFGDEYVYTIQRGRSKPVSSDMSYTRARDAVRGAKRAAKRVFGVGA